MKEDYILDTNALSAVINGNKIANTKFMDLLWQRHKMFISCITYYEAKGGLLAANATKKLAHFNRLCNTRVSVIYLDDRNVLDCASQIYADLKRAGTPVGTPDILIAATAITRGLVLVSRDRDMLRIPGATVEDWLDTGQ